MSTLGSLLVQDQVVGVTQIEQAFQRQVIYGGDLATNLMELGLLGEKVLAEYSARALGLPLIAAELIESPDEKAIKMMPWSVVNEHRVLAVQIEDNQMTLATSTPLQPNSLEEVSFLLGVDFIPCFMPEMRLAMALNLYYGIPLAHRLASLQRRFAPEFVVDQTPLVLPPEEDNGLVFGVDPRPSDEKKETKSDEPIDSKEVVSAKDVIVIESEKKEIDSTLKFVAQNILVQKEVDLASKSAGAEQTETEKVEAATDEARPIEPVTDNISSEPVVANVPVQPSAPVVANVPVQLSAPVVANVPVQPSAPIDSLISEVRSDVVTVPAQSAAAILDIEEAQSRFAVLNDRDSILNTFVDFAGKVFEFAILFVIHGKAAEGRTAVRGTLETHNISRLQIPLDQGGMFESSFIARSFYLGVPGNSNVDEGFFSKIGREKPRNCAILPVTLRGRVILMLYGDSGAFGVQSEHLSDLTRLTRFVGDSFERLLLKRKYGEYKPVGSLIPNKPKREALSRVPVSKPLEADDWAGRYHIKAEGRSGKIRQGAIDSVVPPPARRPSTQPPRRSEPPPPRRSEPPPPRRSEPPPPRRSEPPPQRRSEPPAPRSSTPPRQKVQVRKAEIIEAADSPGSYSSTRDFKRVDSVAPPPPSPETKEKVAPPPSSPPPLAKPIISRPPAAHNMSDTMVGTHIEGFLPSSPPPPEEEPEKVIVAPERGVKKIQAQIIGEKSEGGTSVETTHSLPESEVPQPVKMSSVVPVNVGKSNSRSVVVEMNEEIDRLVERVLNPRQYDQTAAELLVGIGDDAIVELIKHFPGPLLCDRYQETDRLRRVEHHGPLLKTLLKFGRKIVPYIKPLFNSRDSDARFYATFLFSELSCPEILETLVKLLFDGDRQIRALAVDVVRGFEKHAEYGRAMQYVVDALTSAQSSLDAKRIAAESLGELREVSSLDLLTQMLGSVDGVLVERCHRALVKITFVDYGFSEQRWRHWWEQNRHRHRIEWAIESITNGKEHLRNAAISELKKMLEDVIEWPRGPMDHKARKGFQNRLRQWWTREGRALYPMRNRN